MMLLSNSFHFNFYFHNYAAVEHTILRSWAVKDFAPNVPQYVQIFRWVRNSRHSRLCMCALCVDGRHKLRREMFWNVLDLQEIDVFMYLKNANWMDENENRTHWILTILKYSFWTINTIIYPSSFFIHPSIYVTHKTQCVCECVHLLADSP